jgi:hypothetical protein
MGAVVCGVYTVVGPIGLVILGAGITVITVVAGELVPLVDVVVS